LRSFTLAQFHALGPLEYVSFGRGEIIFRQNEPITHLIFPDEGLWSVLFYLSESVPPVDVWSFAGPYGMLGSHTLLHRAEAVFEFRARLPSFGWRVSRDAMHDLMARDIPFSRRMQELVRLTMTELARIVFCRSIHSREQRVCRLLLTTSEGIGSNAVALSRATLAEMEAMSRSHVYAIAETLDGVVRFSREAFEIIDRPALEARACDCLKGIYEWRARIMAPR
jgi:CRP-like cAMP-binding protein